MRVVFPLLFLLSGCSLVGGTDATDDLDDARRLWADADLGSYTMTLTRGCFCLEESIGPFEVTVEDGVVVSATREGETVPTDRVLTVDALFDVLEDAYRRDAHRVEVTYDPTQGYPTTFFIDYDAGVADEELGYTVENLERR